MLCHKVTQHRVNNHANGKAIKRELADAIAKIVIDSAIAAESMAIDLQYAVIEKFEAHSPKIGWQGHLAGPDGNIRNTQEMLDYWSNLTESQRLDCIDSIKI